MSQIPGKRSHRQLLFASLWLLSALLIAGSHFAPNERVRVLDSRGHTALQPEISWTVPVLKMPAIDQRADWPFWLFVIVGSLLLSLLGWQMLAKGIPPAVAFVLIAGLGLLAKTEHLALAAMLFAISLTRNRDMRLPLKLLGWLGCLWLGVWGSLEFGIVAFVYFHWIFSEFWSQASRRLRLVSMIATLPFVWALFFVSGFSATAIRPISWMWQPQPDSIFSQSFSVFAAGHDVKAALLLALFFLYGWLMVFRRPEHVWKLLWPLCLLTLVGFGNAEYLWISGVTLALFLENPIESKIPPRIGYLVLAVALIFAVVRFVPHSGSYLDLALGEATPPLVDPASWDIDGKVMLLDLSQSSDWQEAKTRERFPLLLDDRWEIFHEQYQDYAAACRDMREILADSYLREDQEWGGYKRWLNEWSPTLLVANSANEWDIRRLSLSPHWRVMGIDSQRTIFGDAQEPKNYAQSAKALGMIMQLEWPPLAPAPWHENVIAASTPGELLKVSKVLNALRFPYAALRLLPEVGTPEVHQQRMWCHLEIAHRVIRHSGQGSLLDQYRGVSALRHQLTVDSLSADDALRGLASLEGLGLEHLANDLAKEWRNTRTGSTLTTEQQTRLEAIQERTKSAKPANSSNQNAETKLRQALLEGDAPTALEQVESHEEPLNRYYFLIVLSRGTPLSTIFNDWSALVKEPGLLGDRDGEALFYLGCLALEVGNSEAGVSAFRESEQVEPNSPFQALRQMYRVQMGDR